eukprot:Plantae.Rhodophyta-Purpureofilum_apyrenoidigerum.ctg20049.p1 GENE.Plantae.Rhodophyta-Purpureofilum_apyrenoidigerum.ctg20049~~Plantae.Rhodophyta-Purpureofilum_apyrenoidigerum.ctg20049.p1  ORF type:complete len:320 (+),score=72.15 Plantae.Rhodophyta-Purpureofilum_apyrenoidigerum.ctg20049:140-961(+)
MATEEVQSAAVEALARAMKMDSSALVRHEAAYVLGQTENAMAVPHLDDVLQDRSEDPMVRHEAAEALGAIATEQCVEILLRYAGDEEAVVRETVEIALQRCEKVDSDPALRVKHDVYQSVDPVPAAAKPTRSVPELGRMLKDQSIPLFERYEAMFALRNLANGSDGAVYALCDAFGDPSALFRHELAYVLGQVQSQSSVAALANVLFDKNEAAMVRHEAAEALGSVGTLESEGILRKFLRDEAPVVRESCEVALDITDYNVSSDFQYADTVGS